MDLGHTVLEGAFVEIEQEPHHHQLESSTVLQAEAYEIRLE